MPKKFLILILIIIIGFVGYWFWRESIFSKEILRLEILGPEKATVGEEIEYTVKYKNNGNFVLENPKLTFNMPENSLTEDSRTRITQDLNDIYPGDEEFVKFKTRLLGKEGDLKAARVSLSYTPKNLTAPFESSTTFTTKIETVPITLDFDLPSKVERGKDLRYSINYFSNVDYPLENLSIKIGSVSGFNLKFSDPLSLDNSEWKLNTLNKAQGGRINITGEISADIDQNLFFSAKLGMWQNGVFVVIKEAETEVQAIQPLLYISQLVNGSADYIASPGETLHYQISFRNIGSTPFDNLFMVVKLDGSAIDMPTLNSNYGQVQQDGSMIVWDSDRTPQLRHLDVQQSGEVNFYVKVRSDWVPSSSEPNNSVINDMVNISQITQKFSIKVNSGLAISQKAYYKDSSISNSGPIPPKVGETTTYAIAWNITNYGSEAKNVKARATLPDNVNLTGQILPQNEFSNFSFDSASREIVWSAGDVSAGTGVNGDPVFLSFQISLTPQSSQKGYVASLIGQAYISGENQFTGTIITTSDFSINTSLPDDFANSGGGIVQ
ncbi:MAG: hypothetical protein A2402_03350 [Candidatus Staskawiczbacteria bacterium RIFOXYC1_FULL_37_43]|nr:MAG: hypothetical protein A2813_03640 [Candidatus Staskawiczbacteria bacterium RIFCSPHIGHO2_01_FULL_37_17]OGZ71297.1 MAG: hypothetical protein A2891_00215 [Candidatus Staskawiczbacteria bacterium RIFCSPLOWO2_01_FULL_37_19]OGZ76379.1 MAG: hypothetical protein A2205_01300 [Candidatus Staskawiczbacteria bacterium RIFOXYA1_FULL_37_15]OGZ77384.1 MAG: hypothetical protein A2280_00725 [Candidatus Staskawiczbacteria bacterium RIFOXYA12_FULL_37_10]OGZ80395.1 MAG: hypothetical protein A2353_04010 [Can